MRISLGAFALLASVQAASWSFTAAKLDIGDVPHPFSPSSESLQAKLNPEEKFRLSLTTTLDGDAKRPHQAMLLVKTTGSELEANLVIPVKANGRAAISISYQELGPTLLSSRSIDLTLVLGGFGDSTPFMKQIATLAIEESTTNPIVPPVAPLRYGPMPEIFHTFKPPQKMPPRVVSVAFSLFLLAGLFGLLTTWSYLGANLDAFSSSFKRAPLAYLVLLASLFAIEGALFLYWSHWRIMRALGTLVILGIPAFFSARYALAETEQRRKAGSR